MKKKDDEAIKLNELHYIYRNIDDLLQLKGVKLSYCIVKNKNLLLKEIQILEELPIYKELKDPSPKYKEYLSKKNEIEQKINISDKSADLSDEIKKLDEQYQDEIKERELKIKEFDAFILQPSSIIFEKINLSDIPEDVTVKQMLTLNLFVNSDDKNA